MAAYWFRFNDMGPNLGLASAPDMKELFWKIDEHGDPFDCQIARANRYASFWGRWSAGDPLGGGFKFDECEFDDGCPIATEGLKWVTPRWPSGRHE